MDHSDEATDRELAAMFEGLRQRAQALVVPPGAAAAKERAGRRRQTRAVMAIAVLVAALTGGGGYLIGSAGQLAPSPPATSTSSATATSTTGGSPRVTPTPPGGPGSPVAGAGGPSGTPGQPPRCHTAELAAHLVLLPDPEPGGGRAGLLALTNVAGHTCQMYGYPGMQLTDPSGGGLPTEVIRDGAATPTLFPLDPGGTAWARLRWSETPPSTSTGSTATPATTPSAVPGGQARPGAPCDPPAAGLLVTPPDEQAQLSVPVVLRVCAAGRITTGPMRPDPPF